jgi:hypothetical protein
MSDADPEPFSNIEGGRAAFDRAYAELAVVAALGQARFSATLDRIGPPGQARWDPIAGEIELRGRTFEAQQLGSYDGNSWLWSWANPYLSIPEDKTAVARALRDRAAEVGIAALGVPAIAVRDESVKYMLGGIAIAHGCCEAYYIANESQVYLLAPGQLDRPKDPPIARLRAAIDAVDTAGVPCDLTRALPFAARALEIECAQEARRLIVRARDSRDELEVHLTSDGHALRTVALCFVGKQVTLADVFGHLRKKRGLAELPFKQTDDAIELEGAGYAVRITRTDRLRDVMREANRLSSGQDEAKRRGAVLIIDAVHTPRYLGSPLGIATVAFAGKSWAPIGALSGLEGGPPTGPQISNEALHVCERLNQLDNAFLYDLLLGMPYPR